MFQLFLNEFFKSYYIILYQTSSSVWKKKAKFYVIFSSALELTNRTSTVAFDIEIRMKIQFEEFDDALKLVNEWQTIDPEVRFAMI